jgi:hypothetical protein
VSQRSQSTPFPTAWLIDYFLLLINFAHSKRLTRKPITKALNVEVHAELQWVRAHSEWLNFFLALITDPAIDQLGRKDITFAD